MHAAGLTAVLTCPLLNYAQRQAKNVVLAWGYPHHGDEPYLDYEARAVGFHG